MRKNRTRTKVQRDSLRRALSRREPIPPEAGIDLNQFGGSATVRIHEERWLILLLYVMFVLGNQVQWLQYTVILNVVAEFYHVSPMAVKATAMMWSIFFIILLYPMTWLIHKKGTRFICVIASASICLGTWIKYFAIYPNQFSLILVGQCLVGAWQLTVVSLPATLAATWFGPKEMATATAFGYTGTVFGVALSYVLGPLLVKTHNGEGDIGKNLNHYTLLLGFYCTSVLFLMFWFFPAEPKFSPSKSRALQKLCASQDFEFFRKLCRLLRNRNYLILWNAHGLISGVFIALNVSLNTLYTRHFENGEEDIARIGLLYLLSGYCGSMFFARILDRFKIFKRLLILLYIATILMTPVLAGSMHYEIRWAVYLSVAIHGFFASGYYTSSLETCAELTYPEPVTICVAILNVSNQLYSTIFVACIDKLAVAYSDLAAYAFIFGALILGFILTCVTRDERRRESAGKLQ